jgi:hypothetical protein
MGGRLLTRGVELWCGRGYGILSEETRFGADADGRHLQHNTLHTAACKEKDNIVAELSGVASLSSCVKEMSCSQVWFLCSKGSPLTSPIPLPLSHFTLQRHSLASTRSGVTSMQFLCLHGERDMHSRSIHSLQTLLLLLHHLFAVLGYLYGRLARQSSRKRHPRQPLLPTPATFQSPKSSL